MVQKMVGQQNISKLSDDQVQKIKNLESELGVIMVAYNTSPYADLDSFQVEELQTLERNMGVTLLAYR